MLFSVMDETLEDLVEEIEGRLDILEGSRQTRVDGMMSPNPTLPFKAMLYREALLWRLASSVGAL